MLDLRKLSYLAICASCLVSQTFATESIRLQVRAHDGSAAAYATVRMLGIQRDQQERKVISTLQQTDPDGFVEVKLVTDEAWLSLMAITAPDSSVSLWSFPLYAVRDSDPAVIYLQPNVRIAGKVIDRNYRPVANARIWLSNFGSGTYVYPFPPMLAEIPELSTTSDANGNYTLPSITLNNYPFRVGGSLSAEASIEGRKHTGLVQAWTQWKSEDEEAPIRKLTASEIPFPVEPMKLFPLTKLTGSISDATTKKPISNVEVWIQDGVKNASTSSDQQGHFEIDEVSTFADRQLRILSPLFPCELQMVKASNRESIPPEVEELTISVPVNVAFMQSYLMSLPRARRCVL